MKKIDSLSTSQTKAMESIEQTAPLIQEIRSAIERYDKRIEMLEQNVATSLATQKNEIRASLELFARTPNVADDSKTRLALEELSAQIHKEGSKHYLMEFGTLLQYLDQNLQRVLYSLEVISSVLESLADKDSRPAQHTGRSVPVRMIKPDLSPASEVGKERELLDIIKAISLFQKNIESHPK